MVRRYEKSLAKSIEKTNQKLAAKFAPKTPTDSAPHLIVEARAGTGKTTTMICGLQVLMGQIPLLGVESPMVPSPQQRAIWDSLLLSKDHAKSVCFVAFNKSIASELQRRVPPGVDAMTMHSMGLRAVTATYGKVGIVAHRVDDVIVRLLPQFHDIWELRRKRPGLIPLTKKLVDLCKMGLLEGIEEDCYGLLAHHSMDPGEDATVVPEAVELVPQILAECADVDKDRCIDFADMVWLPVKNKLHVKKYDLLLVDECQDLNRCQQELAKKAGSRLILVGDSHQAIYGFAGADAESMRRMEKELSAPEVVNAMGKPARPGDCGQNIARGCVLLPLTVTRRCGKAIVDEARKLVPDFEAHPDNGPGKVLKMRIDSVSDYSITCKTMPPCRQRMDYLCNDCKAVRSYRYQAEDGDMVLCRLNAPLVTECFKFLKAGRKAGIQGRDIGQGLISTIKATKAESVTDLIHGLSKWVSDQTAKEQAKKHPNVDKISGINDRYDCIMSFVEGQSSVLGVLNRIDSVFTDAKDSPGIRLSSIHKAKGLEANRVFIIETTKTRKVWEMAQNRGGWQFEQAQNLQYVAITRAIKELVYVS